MTLDQAQTGTDFIHAYGKTCKRLVDIGFIDGRYVCRYVCRDALALLAWRARQSRG